MYLDIDENPKSKTHKDSKCSSKNVYNRVIPKKPAQVTEFSAMVLKTILSKHIDLDKNQKEQIFKHVEELDFRQGNYFGGVDFLNQKSCVSLLDQNDCHLIACTTFGNGRTIVFNHEAILKEFMALNKDWIIFMKNIIGWLTRNKENSPENPIRILMNSASPNTKIISALKRASLYVQIDYQCVLQEVKLSDYDCLLLGELSTKTSTQNDCKNIVQFVRNGGGLLVAFRGWTFANYGQGKQMKDWARQCLNGKILEPMGFRYNLGCAQINQLKFDPKQIIQLQPEEQLRGYTHQQNPEYVQNYQQANSQLQHDRQIILQGVQQCDLGQGAAGSSFSFSHINCTTIFRIQSSDFCVAGRFGSGKVFTYGHTNIYSNQYAKNSQTKRFLNNVVNWMCGQKHDVVIGLLHQEGQWNLQEISFRDLDRNLQIKFVNQQDELHDVDILCVSYYSHFPSTMNPEFNQRVKQYVQNGGNLFFASHGWVWEHYGEYQQNKQLKYQQNFASYLLLKQVGVYLKNDCFGIPSNFKPTIQLQMTKDHEIYRFLQQDFLQVLRNNDADNFQASDQQVDGYLSKINSTQPAQFELVCSIDLYHELVDAFIESKFNIEKHYDKLSFKDKFICRVFSLMNAISYACPPFICRALPPSLNVYPGFATNRLQQKTVNIYKNKNKVVFTGLYINPGQVVKITHNNNFNDFVGVQLKINFNCDLTNWDNGNLKRFTHIAKTFAIKEKEFLIASPHGGIIYFEVSSKSNSNQPLKFTFHGAYESLYWNQNIHSYEEFETIKKIDSPFFVIETKRIILMGRTQKIFGHLKTKIKKLCNFWNTVIGHFKDYRGIQQYPFEKQAYFNDANIMLGYMHSGTPVMTHEDLTFEMLGVGGKLFRDATWGFYHELGHNHQDYKWTIDQMGEVTCNIYSLYLTHKMHGFTIQKEFWMDTKTQENVKKYFAKPSRTLQDYGSDPFVALGLFAALMEQFGYQIFSTVHKRYQSINLQEQTTEAKVDMLVEQVSQVIGYNLWDYFKNWGLPVTKKSLNKIKSLKKYKCKRFPVSTN